MADEGSKPPDSQQVRGPAMLVATRVMNPGPARVGRLFGDVTLPRTVELPVLIAGGAGAVLGLILGILLGGLSAALYGMVLFGALGVFAVTYSPLEGESLARWLGLTLRSKRHRVTFEGEQVQVSIGIRPIEPVLDETIRLLPGHVDVPSWQYDLRGVRISRSNQNLGEAQSQGEEATWASMAEAAGAPPAWVENGVVGGLGPVRSLPEDPTDDPVLAGRRGRLHQGLPATSGPVPTSAAGPDHSPAEDPVLPADSGPGLSQEYRERVHPDAATGKALEQMLEQPQAPAAPQQPHPGVPPAARPPTPQQPQPPQPPAPTPQQEQAPAPAPQPAPQQPGPPTTSGDGVRRMRLGGDKDENDGKSSKGGKRKKRGKRGKLPRFEG